MVSEVQQLNLEILGAPTRSGWEHGWDHFGHRVGVGGSKHPVSKVVLNTPTWSHQQVTHIWKIMVFDDFWLFSLDFHRKPWFLKCGWPVGGSREVPRALEVIPCDSILHKYHLKKISGGKYFSIIFGPKIFRYQIVIFRENQWKLMENQPEKKFT